MTFDEWREFYSPHVMELPSGAWKVFGRGLNNRSRRSMFRLDDMVVSSAVSGPAYILVARDSLAEPRPEHQTRNRTTRYEVAIGFPEGIQRVGFASRVNKTRLLEFARGHAGLILEHLTDEEARAVPTYTAADGWTFGGKVRVFQTGRTEKQVRDEDLPAVRRQT